MCTGRGPTPLSAGGCCFSGRFTEHRGDPVGTKDPCHFPMNPCHRCCVECAITEETAGTERNGVRELGCSSPLRCLLCKPHLIHEQTSLCLHLNICKMGMMIPAVQYGKGFVSKASQFTIQWHSGDCKDTSQICPSAETKRNFLKINFIIDVIIVFLTSQTPEVDLASDGIESPISPPKYQPSWVRHLRHPTHGPLPNPQLRHSPPLRPSFRPHSTLA